ncbi:LAFE_0D04962g1_1 [Lachancea fermentati]|uniref:LAFE_0D04962g1_1 n=1 Tax=Lachancea fermentati TaxID=4955 RepID=A0A1G4MB99_LACFM|nr:LAFE_0D04962g1_1 [Lachancea fermentati]
MTPAVVASPFCTTLYYKPQSFSLCTGNLWKKISKEDALRLKLDDIGKHAIYEVPSNAVVIKTQKQNNSVKLTCVLTNSEEDLDPIVSLSVPIENTLRSDQASQLTKLAKEFDIEIVVAKANSYATKGKSGDCIFMIGMRQKVECAEQQIKVFLETLKKKVVRHIILDTVSLLPICAGMNSNNLRNFESIYDTEVFLPSMLSIDANGIFLSGDIHSLTLLAEERLRRIIDCAKNNIYYALLPNLSPIKLQFVRQFYRNEINELMNTNQCFINVTKSEVHFMSNSTFALDRTMRSFILDILGDTFEAQILFHDNQDAILEGDYLSAIQTIASQCEVIIMQLQTNLLNFVIVGRPQNVVDAIEFISKLEKSSQKQIKYQLELHPDYKEFISGKKNGKITRIMDAVECSITLDLQNGQGNMIISLLTDQLEKSEKAIKLLQDELPAEHAFFIPEAYHRPVIGTGGSVIQTIMRKHNVFIQFSNSFQLPQNDLGLVRYNNVVIRCPSKNETSIAHAKDELSELVKEYSDLQPKTLLRFSPGQYCYFVQGFIDWKSNIIGEIEKKTSTYIAFPSKKPSENYSLEIRGNDGNSELAAEELIKYFADELEIYTDTQIMDIQEFTNCVAVPLKKAMKIEVTISKSLVRLTYSDLSESHTTRAIALIRDYLSSKGIRITSEKKLGRDFILSSNDLPDKPDATEGNAYTSYPYTYTKI